MNIWGRSKVDEAIALTSLAEKEWRKFLAEHFAAGCGITPDVVLVHVALMDDLINAYPLAMASIPGIELEKIGKDVSDEATKWLAKR